MPEPETPRPKLLNTEGLTSEPGRPTPPYVSKALCLCGFRVQGVVYSLGFRGLGFRVFRMVVIGPVALSARYPLPKAALGPPKPET